MMTSLLKNRVWGWFLSPLSLLYRMGMAVRNQLYDRKLLKSTHLGVRTLSIGNLTVGGTGKTPLVSCLARNLKASGKKVAILSRGYGRAGQGIDVVSDGESVLLDARIAGDEPYLLARQLNGVVVIVGADRVKTGRIAVERFGCDMLLLDDSFQHRRIARDLDLVVVDASNPWGNGRLLPAGPLREPLSSLKRASAIILTRVDEAVNIHRLVRRIRRIHSVPLMITVHAPDVWVRHDTRQIKPLRHLKDRPVLAFSGIGNPDSFRNTLEVQGVRLSGWEVFRDHHWYTSEDMRYLEKKARQCGAEALVTTEKDAVRIPDSCLPEKPLYSLRIRLNMIRGSNTFDNLIRGDLEGGERMGSFESGREDQG